MDPFERHGIRHLSPSSLALYRHSPSLWCLRYLYGVKDEAGAFAWRGRAVEQGVDGIILDGISDDEAIERAKHAFETEAQGEISPEIDKQRRAIPKMLRQATAVFRRLGKPVARQHRVEIWVDDIEVPIIGYADYVYPEFVVDLKTTFALPAMPRPDDAVQVVLYADALSRRPGLVYATPARFGVYPHNAIEIDGARRVLRQSAHAIRAMLAAAEDREHAAALFVPDVDNYRWTETTRDAAERVWMR
jgi:PD-(D/E)XK nuclease superfamily protein